ncbi:MAG: hypothetical protein GXX94_04705 [Chloroflexi bacterium]|nr:hypothetical protein [Chloroflexota bacterium]
MDRGDAQARRGDLDVAHVVWYRWTLLALFVAGLGLRLYHLGIQCFWFDEAQTLSVAGYPFGEIIRRAYRPPLYHFLLHVWASFVPGTEFWLRLPSALSGALVPPLIGILGGRLYNRRVGILAAALAAFSPALVAYAQELRMYSLMGLQSALLCWAASRLLREEQPPRWLWAAFWGVLVAAMYTHYFALPFVLTLGALGVLMLARQRRWKPVRGWITVHALAGAAFVPWLAVIFSGRGGTEDYVQAEISPVLEEVPGVLAFLNRLWLFYSTGPTTSDWALVRTWAQVAGLAFIVAVALFLASRLCALRRDREHPASWSDAGLLALVIIPVAVAAAMYSLRPGTVHPRHLMMISVPLLLLCSRIADWLWQLWPARAASRGHIAGRAGAAIWIFISLGLAILTLVLYYVDPALQRADVRVLAERVRAFTSPGDVVLLPYQDYAFEHYYNGPAEVLYLETRVGDVDLLKWAIPRMAGAERAVLLRWVHIHADPRDALDWFLESNGRLEERFWEAERWASVYKLGGPPSLPEPTPDDVRFGPVTLTGVYLPAQTAADDTVAVALGWTLAGTVDEDLKVSVRLVDAAGHTICADDRVLLSERGAAGTTHWVRGVQSLNYYLLDVPPGTPPVDYSITATVYGAGGPLVAERDGEPLGVVVPFGSVRLGPAVRLGDTSPMGEGWTRIGAELAPGLSVAAIGSLPAIMAPAEPLDVAVSWYAGRSLGTLAPVLEIVNAEGEVLAESGGIPVYGLYPTERWRPGELVTEHRTLRTAPEAAPGVVSLRVRLGDRLLELGTIQLAASERSYAQATPQLAVDGAFAEWARLVGIDGIPARVPPGGPLAITLYWEALGEPEADYTVFVQLLSVDDRVIAQHDGVPALGRWPTRAWLPGQMIADRVELAFADTSYKGQARLIVGFYESTSLVRVATGEGADHIELGGLVLE